MIILCNNSPIPAIKRNIIFQTLLEGAILVPKKLFSIFGATVSQQKCLCYHSATMALMLSLRPLTVKIAHGKCMISMCGTRFRADFEI